MRVLLALLLFACGYASAAEQTIAHGRFESVRIESPTQRAEQFVLLLADGASEGARLAKSLAAKGALVATIDTRALFGAFERDDAECVSPNGDLENLSHYIQAMQRLDSYHAPILVGAGAGAPFVYAMLAQSPADTFAGGISLRFCPELAMRKRLCEGNHLKYASSRSRAALTPTRLQRPWTVLDTLNATCANDAKAFAAKAGAKIDSLGAMPPEARVAQAYLQLVNGMKTPGVAQKRPLPDLPLVEVTSTVPGDTFVVMVSGDGGWAGLDKEVARIMATAGMPVVGLDSLRYFWAKRTPETFARDLDRIVLTYAQRWRRKHVVVIGYSHGADVVPFAINRLNVMTRSLLSSVVLIGLAERASFEFHVGNWIGLGAHGEPPTAPEMRRMRAPKVVCIHGSDDTESKCTSYENTSVRVVALPGGHHFNGDYAKLARTIVGEVTIQKPD